MQRTVIVIPSDNLIAINGAALCFSFEPIHSGMHALQWDGQQGHIEWEDDYNWPLSAADPTAYTDEVAPYVALWDAEKKRRDREAVAAEKAYAALPAVKERKRAEISVGFDAAITASVTMPSMSSPPSAVELALGIDAFRAEDAEGWAELLTIHSTRRDDLLAAVAAAQTADAVQAIAVSYAV